MTTYNKPGWDKDAHWWEGKNPGRIILGLLFPHYAMRHDHRSITAKRIVFALIVGAGLIYLKYR